MINFGNERPLTSIGLSSREELPLRGESRFATSRVVTGPNDHRTLRLTERVLLFFSLILEWIRNGVRPSSENWRVVWTGRRVSMSAPAAQAIQLETRQPTPPPSVPVSQPVVIAPPVVQPPTWKEYVEILAGRKPRSLLVKGVRHSNAMLQNHPEITECHCQQQLSRPGIYQADMRQQLEVQLIERIKKEFPDKTKELCILSVASGGLFQEMVIHSRLVKLGYRIHWIFNDTMYAKPPGQEEVETKERMDPEQHPAIKTFRALATETGSRVTVLADRIQDIQWPRSTCSQILKDNPPDVTLMVHSDLATAYEIRTKRTIERMKAQGYVCRHVRQDPDPQMAGSAHVQIYDLIRFHIRRLSDTPQVFAQLDTRLKGEEPVIVETLPPLHQPS